MAPSLPAPNTVRIATDVAQRGRAETVRRRMTLAPVNVTISAATARSAQLAVGDWYLIASNDCNVRQGGAAIEAAATDHFVPYGVEFLIRVTTADSDDRVAVIGTSGTLQLRRAEAI